jgi:hypothetical protein
MWNSSKKGGARGNQKLGRNGKVGRGKKENGVLKGNHMP